jgi:uncharacterized protein
VSRRASGFGVAAATVLAAGAGAFAWGSLVERRHFVLRHVSVPVLPAGAEPITVLHLSDMHMAPWQRDKQEWVRSLVDYRPDLVVDTGDNLGHPQGIAGIEYALEPFAGTPGVFVNGSNDYFGPKFKNPLRYFRAPRPHNERPAALDIDRLESFFGGLGWTDLNNTAAELTIRGTRVEFFGVDDPHLHYDRLDAVTSAVDELRENSAGESHADERTLSVGVAHAPYRRVLDSFVTQGAQLILAGHTHGGQVCVPGVGALVTNCDLPRKQASGLSVWPHALRAAYLNVSAGLGTSIYAPVRFACPPEATLLTLTSVFQQPDPLV